ncbi:YceD family protein [Aquabacterium sp.]|uniref:YceD family protein n=1 Tax=Aquabacterium sp. TaxID=1872578 RepID=UPI002BAB249F|nr:DUF177 domain-containing protein [Aquabacterium sp.]HSW04862.1 DUF177 domain-containing protein [Aquabacterium sp.]
MKTRQPDPLRLDVAAFAADAAELSGDWPGVDLTRLAATQAPPQDIAPAAVAWRASGERRAVAGSEPELWLHLSANAAVWLTCQRCLQPFEQPLAVDTRVRFVRDEAQAEALDAELEEDVLALPRWLDLRTLIEDELLLALPLVPRHEHCPQPLPVRVDDLADDDEAPAERPNPFAVLQALKPPKAG